LQFTWSFYEILSNLKRTFPEVALNSIYNDLLGNRIHHQHGNKSNLASYVLGQCWISLAMIVRRASSKPVALPVLSRLMPSSGKTGKLIAAKTLIRTMYGLLQVKNTCIDR